MSHIQDKSEADLEALLAEADRSGKGEILLETWRQDVKDRKAFHSDQLNNG